MVESLVERVRRLLLKPAEEWASIDLEPGTMGGIYRSYVVPLVAFSAIASSLHLVWAGLIGVAILSAILLFILWLAGVYLFALIIDALAPTFGAQRKFGQAFKVSAYFPTAAWLASVFAIIPPLRVLVILGLYSIYLLYLGLPKLMKCPESQAVAYTLVVAITGLIAMLILSLLMALPGLRLLPF
jgi:hypothetical protein